MSDIFTKTIIDRIDFSTKKLKEVQTEINSIKELSYLIDTCIYVTGSFARKEATEKSDLDLFFISKEPNPISKLNKILLDAELIKLNGKLGFPDFSNDGEYLTIHSLADIKQIGSQDEDSKNYFTARMLLLLESQAIHNELIYDQIIDSIVESYLRDFHDHEKEFKPIFLVNDISRYWKTLCLNYEHKRNRIVDKSVSEQEAKMVKLKSYKKNLKLQFSRKFTCFSFILSLVSDYIYEGSLLNHHSIKKIVISTPSECFLKLSEKHDKLKLDISSALLIYSYFLELSSQPDNWLENENNRNDAFAKSREFGIYMFKILENLIQGNKTDILRYIVL